MRAATVVGVGLFAVHAALLPVLLRACDRPAFAVDVRAPLVADTLDIQGAVPAGLGDRVRSDVDGASADTPLEPGLHQRRWQITYRGNFQRAVAVSQLTGPFQRDSDLTCTGRLALGQGLLDDGLASPGTLAHVLQREVERNLAGMSQAPIGDFKQVRQVRMRWRTGALAREDAFVLGTTPAADGYVRTDVVIEFDRVAIDITVAMIPRMRSTGLEFELRTRAHVVIENRFLQWISDRVGADRFATRIARQELDRVLVAALEPPPPIDLGDGRALRFDYCGQAPIIASERHALLPFAVRFTALAGPPAVAPPAVATVAFAPPNPDADLTLDLDPRAVSTLLFEAWRQGVLDNALAEAGLDQRFNTDPTVAGLLSLRISPPRLTLPPVVRRDAHGLHAAVAASVTIADGASQVRGNLHANFRLSGGTTNAPPTVDLTDVSVTCEPTAGRLEPCYAELVEALRTRAPELQAPLSALFAELIQHWFVGARLTDASVPATLALDGAHASIPDGAAGLRLELDATLTPK